ncbi:Protein F37C4.5 [Schistosoma japonicum]|nr:Protein F37C4.5 [Schistosoma japonicum]
MIVIGSLQPLRPEQYIMHHQTGVIRQQEMIVVNPQTGEVLNDRYTSSHQATNAMTTAGTHHFARNITSNDTVVPTSGNVNGPPVGSGSTTGQQKGSIYPKTGQNSTDGINGGGGVGTNSSGSGGGGARSGASVGGLDRSRQVYNMFECQMSQLTVFLDRALICRRIRPRFSASDITEVVFEHLSPTIDKDSIRFWSFIAILEVSSLNQVTEALFFKQSDSLEKYASKSSMMDK